MNRDLFDIAHKLEEKLNGIDTDADKASLIWAHGFLTGLVANLTSRVPELALSGPLEKPETPAAETIRRLQEESGRILDSIENTKRHEQRQEIRDLSRRALKRLREMNLMSDEPDSLERLLDDLDESGPTETSGVPASRTPSPKGLSGGVALPLPTDTDYKM
jgi:hypothetical protein